MTNGQPSKPLDWPTLVLILISGGTNFFATRDNATQRQADAYKAFRQISDLHSSIDEFERRQKNELDNMELALRNQTNLLQGQTSILREVHSLTTREQYRVFESPTPSQ